MEEEKYYNKYLKYKNKYLDLKNNELLYNILNGGMKKNITLEEITLEEILERINHYNTVSNTYKQYEEELKNPDITNHMKALIEQKARVLRIEITNNEKHINELKNKTQQLQVLETKKKKPQPEECPLYLMKT
jgi:hypothetical protein